VALVISDLTLWLQKIAGEGNQASLLCFPYAGSGVSVFGGWRSLMFDGADLIAARLPGRDGRLREPAYDNVDALAAVYTDIIATSRLGRSPLFLLGCSVGALVAFELTRQLQSRGIAVDYLIVAAARAPQLRRGRNFIHTLPDDKFIRKLQKQYGPNQQALLSNPEIRRLLIPTLRADVKMFETYSYRPGPKLECPILALGGTEDKAVSLKELVAWRDQTNEFHQRLFPGNHYFTRESKVGVLQTIAGKLSPFLDRDSTRSSP
jgi:surfactin synthase thioesterase subunit